jgi:signal peptidase I
VPSSGDRILVLKWPYDIGSKWLGPHRWDVVVFKDPQEGDQNYIKRLLGLPGEVLEVIDGDVYTAPSDAVPADIREALSKPPPPGRPEARRLNQEQEERLAKILRIQRKTRVAQESLWMLHYDNDYKPNVSGLPVVPPFIPAWTPEDRSSSPWDTSTSRVKFKPADTREHWMQLTGKPIEDDYGYNNVQGMPRSPHYVGDVRVRFVLVPGAAQGSLSLELRKGSDGFVARLAADGTAQLYRLGVGPVPIELCKAKTEPLVPLKPVTIEFENVDYRVTLRVNDVEIVATGDSQYSPNAAALLRGAEQITPGPQASVRIGAAGMPLEMRHLAVHRDIYYRSDVALDDGQQGKRNPMARYPGWGTATNPILLRTDPPDYFCMGDNSPQSMDGRLWWKVSPLLDARGDYQNGTVPGDQMIGRAFFVYWPGGYRFSKDTPAVIPNVGKMRIIR